MRFAILIYLEPDKGLCPPNGSDINGFDAVSRTRMRISNLVRKEHEEPREK